MACLWAAKIWQHAQSAPVLDQQVAPATLLLRNEDALARWKRVGQVIIHFEGAKVRTGVNAMTIANAPATIDNLLICTKAQDALSALYSVAHLLHPHSRVLLIQNGIKAQQEIAREFPSLSLFCLSTSHGAYMLSDFEVVHAGQGEAYLGSLDPEQSRSVNAQQQLLDSLPRKVMNIHWDFDITDRLWTKFAINCAINALTVIYDCRNGELLVIPAATIELRALCAEIETIMSSATACPQPLALFDKTSKVLESTRMNYSSTLQDVRKARPTEIDYFNGYLCELARKANCQYPLNEALMRRFNALVAHTSD